MRSIRLPSPSLLYMQRGGIFIINRISTSEFGAVRNFFLSPTIVYKGIETASNMPVSDRQVKQKNKRSPKDVNHEEIQALLAKLKEIVPNMPRNRKLSKLEIIQYVIDYIVDLQIALETHHPPHGIIPRTTSSSNRQPLGVIPSPINSAVNSAVAQEVTQLENLVLKNFSSSLTC